MPKKNKNHDKPITKDELGNMLHKFINPLYEKVDKLADDVEDVKGIQLRMENRLFKTALDSP